MYVPVHHHDDGQSHANFRRCHYHNKKYKKLSVGTARRITSSHSAEVMHFGKCYQQQVHRIQHQLNAHEYNDRVAACEHPHNTDAKQRDRQNDVIIYWHIGLP